MTTTAKQRKNRGKVSNLKPWKPGQSGNPNGRPPKPRCIVDALRSIGSEPFGEYESRIEALCRLVYELALKGTPWAVQFIADRTEGKPIQMTVETVKNKTPEANPFDGLTTDELRKLLADIQSGELVEVGNSVLMKKQA